MYTQTWVLAALLAVAAVTGRPAEEGAAQAGLNPAQSYSLQYYGGANGRTLDYQPGVGYVTKWSGRKDEKPEVEEEQGGGQGDGVAIQPPPAGASVAEARPVGLSIAGVGGVAASKPVATAVVGPGGLAITRPVATAIAGVPVGELGLGPEAGTGAGAGAQNLKTSPVAVALGRNRQGNTKYAVLPVNTWLLPEGPRVFNY